MVCSSWIEYKTLETGGSVKLDEVQRLKVTTIIPAYLPYYKLGIFYKTITRTNTIHKCLYYFKMLPFYNTHYRTSAKKNQVDFWFCC